MSLKINYNIITNEGYEFEWDPNKDAKNQEKHGISFTEAASVFDDTIAITIPDTAHSKDEERFVILGASSSNKIVVVIFCVRGKDEKIRIISARKATKEERREYSSQLC